jgi:hypothetical protein
MRYTLCAMLIVHAVHRHFAQSRRGSSKNPGVCMSVRRSLKPLAKPYNLRQ